MKHFMLMVKILLVALVLIYVVMRIRAAGQ
jgi:hypothetical protein